MRYLAALLLVVSSSLVCASTNATAEHSEATSYDVDSYATCSACHLPDGSGVPGLFPPLTSRAYAIARLDGGREYLMLVVLFGLLGDIEVDGAHYSGVMPGNIGLLSEDAMAEALNYMVFVLGDTEPSNGVAPFTRHEIETVKADVKLPDLETAAAKRRKLVEQYGQLWP